jgi:predicted porin
MKHKVCIAAILSGFASIASAQVGSSVTIYGVLDSGLAVTGGDPKGSTTKVASGVSQSSRLGFKGSEDLGNGLSVRYVLESGILVDTGASDQNGTLFGREASVSLVSNKFGAIGLGRQYTPIYKTLTVVDPYGNNYGGAAGRLMKAETGGTRMDNSVTYTTPTVAGFDAKLAYGFGEVAGDSEKLRQIGGVVGYQNGPLVLRVAHHQTNNASATDRAKTTLWMAKYDFGFASGSVGYGVNKGLKDVDNRDLLLGVSVPLGQHKLMASYIRKDDRSSLSNYDANEVSVAYNYQLSKRTALYAAYARLSNTNFTTTKFGTGPREFDLGLRHTF